ncbi:MAG: DUF4136 domain-containing protein [Xanthomonadales bacterium]|nr:DUF4136 domain-containing protein [Gammaproteobacteria bacterium]MBT8065076.1 DUF4136 domain-containing protein [Gammaproteobacteria bacterium]NNJ66188.1 DUF4136 domain-containing protein [Xanthomonadales bacterium]NNK31895.1 DUF4136 domain-containing protein [Xanthomonadales bacterium]NNK37291.1 DUF4136 domain-containing protein [Xanthomonadales bacterium]
MTVSVLSLVGRSARRFLLATAGLLVLSSCSSGIQVRSDIDPSADFSSYTTWNFFNELGIEGGYNSPIYGEHFRAAISREMAQRGYRKADDPDLRVNVTIRTDDKVKMRTHTAPYMSGNYYRRPGSPYYGSSMGVGVGVGSRPTQTTEASVFIDLVDSGRNRMSWQGVAVIDANDKVAQQLRDAVYTAVEKVFAQYPHTAGN